MNSKIRKNVEMEAVVFPPCNVCGMPYRPSKPIATETVYFESKDWLANFLYRVERYVTRMRKARMRNL